MPAIRKCLFPTAGLGTRFLPLTRVIPKEMLPIVNKPLIQYGVEEAVRAGINDMAIITGQGKQALEDYFAFGSESEREIASAGRESLLEEINGLVRHCDFSYARQIPAKGLGHAILTGEPLIGEQPFAVVLPDDFCITGDAGVLSQLLDKFEQHRCSIIAIQQVKEEETSSYGIIDGEEISPGLFRVKDMIEKPAAGEAPGNLAVIGRYILTPDIFDILRTTPPGRNDEIQLTDALRTQARAGKVLAWRFAGHRFDCGSVEGYIQANNYVWGNGGHQ